MKRTLHLPVLMLAVPGCAGQREPTATQTGEQPDAAAQPAGMQQQKPMPAADAQALWQYMQAQYFEQQWQLFPGTQRYYKGTDPHGALLTTYVNPIAYDAISGKTQSLPANSIIVKQNYKPDRTLAATTVMYKVSGYDPEHQDWFWLKRLPDGTIEAAGKAASCQSCHQKASGRDYVFTEAGQ